MNFNMDVFDDVTKIKKNIIKERVDCVCAGSPC